MVPKTDSLRPLADVERGLARVRSAARRLLTVQALAWLLAVVAGGAFAIGAFDYALRQRPPRFGSRFGSWVWAGRVGSLGDGCCPLGDSTLR